MKYPSFLIIGISLLAMLSLQSCRTCLDCDLYLEDYEFVYKNNTADTLWFIGFSFRSDTTIKYDIAPGQSVRYVSLRKEGPSLFDIANLPETSMLLVKWPGQNKCTQYGYNEGLRVGSPYSIGLYQKEDLGNRSFRYTYAFNQMMLDTAKVCP